MANKKFQQELEEKKLYHVQEYETAIELLHYGMAVICEKKWDAETTPVRLKDMMLNVLRDANYHGRVVQLLEGQKPLFKESIYDDD